jgi:exopolyphosphatase / guanosine-5'-triphosphate,3'-diphosphate pyrophosphatase
MARPEDKPPTTVAVIDIGSNSGRVVVYRYQAGGHLQLLAGSRASLRLVRELDETHRLGDEAIARAFEAVSDFNAIAQGTGAEKIAAVATAAVRDAENGGAFIARLRKELELDVRVLSGEEEARFGFLGAVGGLPVEHGVLFDVGGGSMQVSRFRQRRLMSSASLPLGSLRLSDAFLHTDPPSKGEVRRLREHVRERLEEAGLTPLEPGEELVGTGGTVRNLAKIDRRARPTYPITRLHGYVLGRKRVREIVERVASTKLKKRDQIPGLNDDRGDSIAGGGLAIQTLMEVLEATDVLVSGQGVREGLATSLVTDRLSAPAAVRQSSLSALAARFDGWLEEPARRRTLLVETLLGALELEPDPEIQEALSQAASLLDIGRSVDFFERHEHVADIVLATDLNGFTHRAVAVLSAILRQAGDEDSSPKSYAPLLTAQDVPAIQRAAALLVLGDDIEERCPDGKPITLDCRVRNDEVEVRVHELLAWRPRTLGRRFERAFGRTLVVKTAAELLAEGKERK